jgi:hypothetical protein
MLSFELKNDYHNIITLSFLQDLAACKFYMIQGQKSIIVFLNNVYLQFNV